MPLYGTLASLSQTAANNVADGAVDAPSTIDQQTNLLASFIAQIRDGALGTGQCRLVKSGSNLVLQPYNGNRLTINGTGCIIPSAGVSLAPTSLTANTLYYIYAVATGSAVSSIEASTTGHSTDTTTGMEIKNGDPTRTLVGMARPITGPAWQDATNQRFVVSWFNQHPLLLQAVLGSTTGNFSTGVYTIISSSLLLEFLCWTGRVVQTEFQGSLSNNVLNAISQTAAFLDAGNSDSLTATQAYAANATQPVYCSLKAITPSEGYHAINIYANQNVVSTASYIGSGTPGFRCVHSGVIHG